MPDIDLVDRLAAHRTLGSAPRPQLAWLAAHGTVRRYPAGQPVVVEGQPITDLSVIFSGRMSIRVDRGTGPRKVMEWRAGDVAGLLPFSRMRAAPGTAVADEDLEALFVPSSCFRDLVRECFDLTGLLVHVMLDRARIFMSSDLQVEKILSLGRLAAGIAHELNNPASAVARSAAMLDACLTDVERASEALGAAGLSPGDVEAIVQVRRACGTPAPRDNLTPLERADREEMLVDWLERHGIDARLAEPLADSTVEEQAFDRLARSIDPAILGPALRWVAAICATRRLADEIETAASRIHHLVAAIRGFTYMDQAAGPKSVDVAQGLNDTLTVLRSKARSRTIAVSLAADPDLLPSEGFGGELNQVWANLLDNALDAAPESGHVEVTAKVEGAFLVVRVVDDGPGIPADVQPRLFEPFFTTKPIGVGTGLGLDLARRIVSRHDGFIEVDSVPGRTEFRVLLPLGPHRWQEPTEGGPS